MLTSLLQSSAVPLMLVVMTALFVSGGFLFGLAWAKPDDETTVAYWQRRADYWMQRAVHAEDDGVPSTQRDVQRQREWRERRALNGPDHRAKVIIDAENHAGNDGWAAHELLQFCCGGERE